MKVAFDTSVLVAASLEFHPHFDALHVVAAEAAGADLILTFNATHFHQVAGDGSPTILARPTHLGWLWLVGNSADPRARWRTWSRSFGCFEVNAWRSCVACLCRTRASVLCYICGEPAVQAASYDDGSVRYFCRAHKPPRRHDRIGSHIWYSALAEPVSCVRAGEARLAPLTSGCCATSPLRSKE